MTEGVCGCEEAEVFSCENVSGNVSRRVVQSQVRQLEDSLLSPRSFLIQKGHGHRLFPIVIWGKWSAVHVDIRPFIDSLGLNSQLILLRNLQLTKYSI